MVPLAGDDVRAGKRDSLATDELLARRQADRRAELATLKEAE